MIKIGDIVFRRYKGGVNHNKPNTKQLGLVIKEYKEKGAVPQYHVRFDQKDPKWYYQHDLHRIEWRKENKYAQPAN